MPTDDQALASNRRTLRASLNGRSQSAKEHENIRAAAFGDRSIVVVTCTSAVSRIVFLEDPSRFVDWWKG